MKTRTVLMILLLFVCVVCIMQTASAWWDNNWENRKTITIDHDQIPESLEWFPVLINLSGSNIFSKIQSDGGDIAFVASNDTYQFNHQLEDIDIAGQTGYAWVNMSRVTASTNTTMFIYYNNSAAANQWNNKSTWDSNYVLVCHYHDDVYDSTRYYNNGTNQGTIAKTGIAADGRDFEHDDHDYVNYSLVGDHNSFSIEFWHTLESLSLNEYSMGNQGDFSFLVETNGNMEFEVGSDKADSGTTLYTVGPWHYTVGTCDGANIKIFTNGVQKDSTACTVNLNTPFWVGMEQDNAGNDWYDGVIDEFRISKTARNSSWITTTYNSIINGSDGGFFVMGAEVSNSNNSPIIGSYSPSDGSTVTNTATLNISVVIEDIEGDLFNYTIETSPNIGHRYGNWSANGTKVCNVSNVAYGTTYTVFVNATDYYGSGNWTNITYSFTTIGGLVFNCFDESQPHLGIEFDIEISNTEKTEVYTAYNITNGHSINMSLTPTGDNTVFVVSNSSFETRVYYYDISGATYLNLTFYLPPKQYEQTLRTTSNSYTGSGNLEITLDCEPSSIYIVQGWNESLYGHWFDVPQDKYTLSDNVVTVDASAIDENTSLVKVSYYCSNLEYASQYVLTVYGPLGEYGESPPVEDAKIIVQRYINTTEAYENVSSVLTDGNGNADMYLISGVHYNFIIQKNGYITEYSDRVPTVENRNIIFRINPEGTDVNESDLPGKDDFWSDITITGTLYENNTIFVTYLDSNGSTIDTSIRVFEYFNGSYTYVFGDSRTGENDYSFWTAVTNASRDHVLYLYFNTSADYGVSVPVHVFCTGVNKSWGGGFTKFDINTRFGWILGGLPVPAAETICILIGLILLVMFGPFHVGAGIISCGFAVGCIQAVYSVYTTNVNTTLIGISFLVVVLGILYVLAYPEGQL